MKGPKGEFRARAQRSGARARMLMAVNVSHQKYHSSCFDCIGLFNAITSTSTSTASLSTKIADTAEPDEFSPAELVVYVKQLFQHPNIPSLQHCSVQDPAMARATGKNNRIAVDRPPLGHFMAQAQANAADAGAVNAEPPSLAVLVLAVT